MPRNTEESVHASLKLPVQEEAALEEKVEEGLLTKFKVAEGSWECDICMVRNDSDKLECAAFASPKPGVEICEEKKTSGKPLFAFGSSTPPSGSATPSSGSGNTFRSGFTFGSSTMASGSTILFGPATPSPSSGSWITFGSSRAGFTLGSAVASVSLVNQTTSSGPLKQGRKVTRPRRKTK